MYFFGGANSAYFSFSSVYFVFPVDDIIFFLVVALIEGRQSAL